MSISWVVPPPIYVLCPRGPGLAQVRPPGPPPDESQASTIPATAAFPETLGGADGGESLAGVGAALGGAGAPVETHNVDGSSGAGVWSGDEPGMSALSASQSSGALLPPAALPGVAMGRPRPTSSPPGILRGRGRGGGRRSQAAGTRGRGRAAGRGGVHDALAHHAGGGVEGAPLHDPPGCATLGGMRGHRELRNG